MTGSDTLRASGPVPGVVSRRDVLLRPAAAAAAVGAAAVAVTAVLAATDTLGRGAGSGAGVVLTVAGSVVLVLAFSGLTGWLMSAVATARPPTLLAAAVGSYVLKVVVFGAGAAAAATVTGFDATAFAVGGTVTLVSWLVAETVGVLRSPGLRSQTFPDPR